MNKRKILLVAVALCMVAILGFGGTLAYLTDYETATNVFTVGNVDITLTENFTENSKLIPNIKVNKDVFVTNEGSEPAFVRVHIAIPTLLDSGDDDNPAFASYANMLHWNMSIDSMADGLWNWHATDVNGSTYAGWPGNGGDWNHYDAIVDGIKYTVYVATYETPLKPGETTCDAITSVYLDAALDNVHIENIINELGEIKILVAAEAVQAAGFGEGTAEKPYTPYKAFSDAMKPANDSMDIINLPTNLIQHIYNSAEIEKDISSDTNANDK